MRNFLGVEELTLWHSVVCFFWVLGPLYFGVCNFLNCNLFLTIFSASNTFKWIFSAPNAPIGGVQVLFGHQKQQRPPLGSSLPWVLKCSITDRSTLATWRLRVKPILDKGSKVQFPRNQFRLIWSILNPWVGLYLGP